MSFRSILRDVKDSIGSFSQRSFEVSLSRTHHRSKTHNQEDLVVIQTGRWANLPPELLQDVIKKLEESENTWPARKNVVAFAGVCRSWRGMCKEIVRTPEFSGKLTFPVSLKQPGPRDGTIQCFIKRNKTNMTYHLFLSLSPALLAESGKFLLAAKRTRRATYREYVISMDTDNISRSSSSYVGKLRSNILGSKFIIYDAAPSSNGCQILSQPDCSRRFNSKKVSPKIPSGNYNIAQVTYVMNMLGPRGPRRMNCIMHSMALQPDGTVPDQPNLLQPSQNESFRRIGSSKIIDNSGDFSSARFSNIVEPQGKEQPLVLRNKPPRWHEQLQCWCLNFKGRVTVASVKNFQLISSTTTTTVQPHGGAGATITTPAPSGLSKPPGQSDQDKIILQFGKVGKDMFTMDYRYPLSAFQAFAICLTSFDTKLVCE